MSSEGYRQENEEQDGSGKWASRNTDALTRR